MDFVLESAVCNFPTPAPIDSHVGELVGSND